MANNGRFASFLENYFHFQVFRGTHEGFWASHMLYLGIFTPLINWLKIEISEICTQQAFVMSQKAFKLNVK